MRIKLLVLIVLLAYHVTSGQEPSNRIFGGQLVKTNEITYQAAVGFRLGGSMQIFCGGSYIHPRFVLSAAHCLEPKRHMVVMLGTLNLDMQHGDWYDVMRVIVPKKWKRGSFNHDITLLQTSKPIDNHGRLMVPVRLPSPREMSPLTYDRVWVSGWGMINKRETSTWLKKIMMMVVDENICRKYWAPEENPRICCVSETSHWGTCAGDSGGGLVVNNIIFGVLSYGTEDCSLNEPEVYTSIQPYSAWIHAQIVKYKDKAGTVRKSPKYRYSKHKPKARWGKPHY